MDIPFELRPLLGRAELDATDYHSLKVGDVIILDQMAHEPLSVKIGETIQFQATPGLFHNHKAIKIDG